MELKKKWLKMKSSGFDVLQEKNKNSTIPIVRDVSQL